MQMGIIEVFICRRLHMNTSMIPICIWLVCRLCTTLHTKCCGAVSVATLQELRDAIEDELPAIPAVTLHNATLSVIENAKKLISINGLQLGIL